MQHEVPLDDSSMSRWRTRVGAQRLTAMLEETVAIAVRDKHVSENELKQVNVDTTVQEKNITYPTDSKLYLKALTKLTNAARRRGIKLRQTYRRVAKGETLKAGRYAHAKQFRRMRRSLKKLRMMLGRVLRDIRRKVPFPDLSPGNRLKICERLHVQEKTDRKKLYSLHEPDVQCISKGFSSCRERLIYFITLVVHPSSSFQSAATGGSQALRIWPEGFGDIDESSQLDCRHPSVSRKSV